MNFPARFLAVFFAFVLIFSFINPSFAQETVQPNNHYLTPNTEPNVENNLHNWTQNVVIDVMSALSCQLAGVDPTRKDYKCLGINKETGKVGYVETNGGLLGFASNSIATLYTPPIHTMDYISYLKNSFGLAKPTYAQYTGGFGLDSLTPFQKIWSVFRNLVYVVFVIVFALIGIAIMFRVKIDPRTVMGIQNQIPKIIIGIVLVTFSIAIAGLLIDLMYVTTYLIVGVIFSADPHVANNSLQIIGATNPINSLNEAVNSAGGFSGISDISFPTAQAIGTHLKDLFDNPAGRTLVGAVTGVFGLILGASIGASAPIIGSLIGAGVGAALGGLLAGTDFLGVMLQIVAFLIIVVAIISTLFRVWFQLIIAYISIIIDIVFAPIWIAAGLLPGSKINFSAWVRSMLGNLAAFPAVIIMFTLSRVFIDLLTSTGTTNDSAYFVPPLIGNPANTTQIGALIALGFILATPQAIKVSKSLFGAPQMEFGSIVSGLMSGVNIINTATRPMIPRLYYRHRNPISGKIETSGPVAAALRGAQVRLWGAAGHPQTAASAALNSRVGQGVSRIRGLWNPTVARQRLRAQLRNQARQQRQGGQNNPPPGGTPPGAGNPPPTPPPPATPTP